MMVHCHKECINDDAQSDEQLHERIEDDESKDLLNPNPTPTTIPYTKKVNTLKTSCHDLVSSSDLVF
jgi:hypothetical protein